LKLIKALINSNIYISLAAVFLTIETQIQLGMKPQCHPYLFIIFFATFFEYNIHRLITVITNKSSLNSDKHNWVRENLKVFYFLVAASIVGFICVVFLANKNVQIALAPIAIVTIFYSLPIFKTENKIFRLREIPYLKIFLIAFVWSYSTILLPIIQFGYEFKSGIIIAMFLERFFFIFAIAIPFDIRDIEADKQAGLKTIPILLNKKNSMTISYLSLFFSFFISFFHYLTLNKAFIVLAIGISILITFLFLGVNKIRNFPYYYNLVLDGTLLLQGLLVLLFYLL